MCHIAIHYHPACAHVTVANSVPCPAGPCPESVARVVPLAEEQFCDACFAEEEALLMAAVNDAFQAQEDDLAAAAQLQAELARAAEEADKVDWEGDMDWQDMEG
ncbi:hypothetical protein MMC32_007917 [Xylographa parallela]|nr:hypothetical protein [Xylographa parallela]